MGDGSVRLYDTQADAVAGAFPSFASFNPGSGSVVDLAKDAIVVGLSSGLHTGDYVTYDAQGNPSYMDDAARNQQISQAEADVSRYCN